MKKNNLDGSKVLQFIWIIVCLGLSIWFWFNVVVKIPELIDAAIKAMGS